MANDDPMTEQQLSPPNSFDCEQSILGSLMRIPLCYGEIESIIERRDFYNRQHQEIYSAIRSLHEQNRAVDTTTVSELLSTAGKLQEVGGRVYLVELAESVVSAHAIIEHAQIVKEKSMLRGMIQISNETVRSCYGQDSSAHDIIAYNSAETASLLTSRRRSGFRLLREAVVDVISSMDEYKDTGKRRGIETGFATLDGLTGGFQKGNLITLCGSPSSGKTAFLCNMGDSQATAGKKVACFSIETTISDFAIRQLCTGGRVNSMKWRSGRLNDTDYKEIATGGGRTAHSNFWICDTPRIEIHSLIAQSSYMRTKHEIDIIYIDYAQLITVRGKFIDRREKTDYIIEKLKELAKILDIPVVALCALSRPAMKHQSKAPSLYDLKESGRWEYESDLVIGLWKPSPPKRKGEEPVQQKEEIIEALILKQRNGPTGKVQFVFEREYTKFTDTNEPNDSDERSMPF